MIDKIAGVFSGLLKPVASMYNANQGRKKSKETANAKIQMMKVEGSTKVDLTDAEWESLGQRGMGDSWKDEYVTVAITVWIPLIFLGAILAAFTGDMSLMNGVNLGLQQIQATGIDMGELTKIVVLAAVGLKLWRGR